MIFNSLELALAYLLRFPGRFIFPIKAGAKYPPCVKDNLASNASNDPEQIRAWVKQFTRKKDGVGPNWGVALKKSKLFVADVDTNPKKNKQGQKTYDDLDLMYGWPDTETVRTPSGGFHKYYEGEHIFALGKYGLGEDIDSPNYVLISGCTFDDGTSYVSENDNLPTAPKPEWFAEVIKAAKKDRVVNAGEAVIDLDKPSQIQWAIDYLTNDAEPSIEGKGGENTTFRVACSLKENGVSESKAFELMMEFYNVEFVCEPLWEPDDLQKKIGNAYAYASLSKAGGKSAEAEFMSDAAEIAETIASIKVDEKSIEKQKERKEKVTKNAGGKNNLAAIGERFAFISNIDRWCIRDDPDEMWKNIQIDNTYASFATKKEKSPAKRMLATGLVRIYEKAVYLPGQPEEIGNCFNLYRPCSIAPKEGDLSWWDAHLEYLFPAQEDRDHVLNWMAWIVQNPSKKPKHALLVQGHVQGTGKSVIAQMFRRVLGSSNVSVVSQTDLRNDFNGWARQCKLIIIEELRALDRGNVYEKLHDIITEERTRINQKNIEQKEVDNCFGIFAMTNHDAAISLDNTDRRYLIVKTEAEKRDLEYYDMLYAKLNDPSAVAAVAYLLTNRDLKGYNGAGSAPETVAKREMIEAGLGDLEHWMNEHGGEWPLNGRIIAVQDVIDSLPTRLQRTNARLSANVSGILKRRFQAEPIGQFTLSNRARVRLLVINGRGVTKIEGWQKTVVALYEKDRANGGVGDSVEDAAGEFDIG